MAKASRADRPPGQTLSNEEKKARIAEEITLWVGNLRLEQALKAEQIGQLRGIERMQALRNSLIIGAIRHCRLNPRADTRLAILTLITFLADNDGGVCHLAVTKITEIFQRSRETIVTCIQNLEQQGQIGVARKNGMPNSYWPLVPAALADLSANTVWLVEALRTSGPSVHVFKDAHEAVAAATLNQSSALSQSSEVDRSSGVDCHPSTPIDEPVKSDPTTGQGKPCSISTLHSTSELEVDLDVVDEAVALYNKAASDGGFIACLAVTDSRRKRLHKRLAEIGGMQAFARALSAIPLMPYLIGHGTKPGQNPFLLDLDTLLSTQTLMGDVLARLVDLAGQESQRLNNRESDAQRKVRLAFDEDTWARIQARRPGECGHA